MAGKVILRMGEAGDDVVSTFLNTPHVLGAPKGGEEALKSLEGVAGYTMRADDVCIWDSLPGQGAVQRVNRWNKYPTAANLNNVLAAFDNKKIRDFILKGRPDKGFAAGSLAETTYTNSNYKSVFRNLEAGGSNNFIIGGGPGAITNIDEIANPQNKSFISRIRGAAYMPIADPYIRRWDWSTTTAFAGNALTVATMFMTLDAIEEAESQAQQKINAIIESNDAKMAAHLKGEKARHALWANHKDVASLKLEAEYKKAYKEVFDSRARGFVHSNWGAVPAGSTAEPFTGFQALFSQLTWDYDSKAKNGWRRPMKNADGSAVLDHRGRPKYTSAPYPPSTQFRYKKSNLTSYTEKKGLTNIDPANWTYPKYTPNPPPNLQEVPEAPDFGLAKQIATGFIAFKLCLAAIGTLAWAFQKLSKHKGHNGNRYEYNSSGERFYHTPMILQPEVGEKLWVTQLKIYIAGHDPIGFLVNLWDGGGQTVDNMLDNVDEEFQNHYGFDVDNKNPEIAASEKARKENLSKKLSAQWYKMAISSIFESCRDVRAFLRKLDIVMSTYKTRAEALINPGGGPTGVSGGSTWANNSQFHQGTEYFIDQPCSEVQRYRAIIRQKEHEIDTFMKRVATMLWTNMLRGSDLKGNWGSPKRGHNTTFPTSYIAGGGEIVTPKRAVKDTGPAPRTIKVRVAAAPGVASFKYVPLNSFFGLPGHGTGSMWQAHAFAEAIMSMQETDVVDPDTGATIKSWRGIIGDVNLRWRGEGYSMTAPPNVTISTSQTTTKYHGPAGTGNGANGPVGVKDSDALPMGNLGREMDAGKNLPCNCVRLSRDAKLKAEVVGYDSAGKLAYQKVDGTLSYKVPAGVKAGQIAYIQVVDGGLGYTEQPVIEIEQSASWIAPTRAGIGAGNPLNDDGSASGTGGSWTADFQQNAATARANSGVLAAASRAMMDRELERLLVCKGIDWEAVHDGMMEYMSNFNMRLVNAGMLIAPGLALDSSGKSTGVLDDSDEFKRAVAQTFGLHNDVVLLGTVSWKQMPNLKKSKNKKLWVRQFGGGATGQLSVAISGGTYSLAMNAAIQKAQRSGGTTFSRFNMLRNYADSQRLYTGNSGLNITPLDPDSKKRIMELGNYTPTFGFCNDATIAGMDQDLATKFFKNKAAYSVYGLPNKIKQGLCQKQGCGALHAYATVPPLGLQHELSKEQQIAIFGPNEAFHESVPGEIAKRNFEASNFGSQDDPAWWATVAKSMDAGSTIGTNGAAWLKKQQDAKLSVLRHPAALPICGDIELTWKFHPTANSYVDRAYGISTPVDKGLGVKTVMDVLPFINKLSLEQNTAVQVTITPQNVQCAGCQWNLISEFDRYATSASLSVSRRVLSLILFNIPVTKATFHILSTTGFSYMPEIWGGWSNSFLHGDNNYKKLGRAITGNMPVGTGNTLLFILDTVLGSSTAAGSLPNLALNTHFFSDPDQNSAEFRIRGKFLAPDSKYQAKMMQTFWNERFIRQGWVPPAWTYMAGKDGPAAKEGLGPDEMWGRPSAYEACDVHALRRLHRFHLATIRQGLFNDLRLGHRTSTTGTDICPVAGSEATFNFSHLSQAFKFGDNRMMNSMPRNLPLGHPDNFDATSAFYDPMQTVRRLSGVCFPVIRRSGIKWKPVMIAVSGAMDGKQAGTAGYDGPWEPSGQIGELGFLGGRSVSYWQKEVYIPAWQAMVDKNQPVNANGWQNFKKQWVLDGLLNKFLRPHGCDGAACLPLSDVDGPMVEIPEAGGGNTTENNAIIPGFEPGKYGPASAPAKVKYFTQDASLILANPNWNPVGVSWAWGDAYKDKQEISLWNQSSDEYIDGNCFKDGSPCIEDGTVGSNIGVDCRAKQVDVSKVLLRPSQGDAGYDLTDTWGGCHAEHDEEQCSQAVKAGAIPGQYGTPTRVDRHTFQGHGEWNKLWGELDQKMGIWAQNFSRVYVDDISFAVFASGSGEFAGGQWAADDVPFGEPVGWISEGNAAPYEFKVRNARDANPPAPDKPPYIDMDQFRTDYVMGAGPATNVVGHANYGKPYYEVADGGIYSSPWHMAWTKNVKERFKVSGWAPYGCDDQGNALPEAAAKIAAFEMASGHHKDYQVVVNEFHLSGTGDYFVKDDWEWTDSNGTVQNYVPIHQHPSSPFSDADNPFRNAGSNLDEMAPWLYGVMKTSGVGPVGTWTADNEGASNAARLALWQMRWAAVGQFGWKKDANGVDLPADDYGPIPADPEWCECGTVEFKTGIRDFNIVDGLPHAWVHEEVTEHSLWVGCEGGNVPPDCHWLVNPVATNSHWAATANGLDNFACGGGACGWGTAGWNKHTEIRPKLDYSTPSFETVATGFSNQAVSRNPAGTDVHGNTLFPPGYGCGGLNDMMEGAAYNAGFDSDYATCCETGTAIQHLMANMDDYRTSAGFAKCSIDWNLKGNPPISPLQQNGLALPDRPMGIMPDVPLLQEGTGPGQWEQTDVIASYANPAEPDHMFTMEVFDANKMGTGTLGALYSYKENATVGAAAGNGNTYLSNPFWFGPSWPEYYHQFKAGKVSSISKPWKLVGASAVSIADAEVNAKLLWDGYRATEGYKAWADNQPVNKGGRGLGVITCGTCETGAATTSQTPGGSPPRNGAVQHFAWQLEGGDPASFTVGNVCFEGGSQASGPTGWDWDSIPNEDTLNKILDCYRTQAFDDWAGQMDAITNGALQADDKLSTDLVNGIYTTTPLGATVGDNTTQNMNGSNSVNSPWNQATFDLAMMGFPQYHNSFPFRDLEDLTKCRTLDGQIDESTITWQGSPVGGGRHATDGGMCGDGTNGKHLGCSYDNPTAGSCNQAGWPGGLHYAYPGVGRTLTCALNFLGDDTKTWDGAAVAQGDGSSYASATNGVGTLSNKQISLYEELITGLDTTQTPNVYQIKAFRMWGTCTLTTPPEYRYEFEVKGCDFKVAGAQGLVPTVDTKTYGWRATGQAFCKPKTMNYEAELVKTRYSGVMFASGWVPYVTGVTDWTNAGHVVASQPSTELAVGAGAAGVDLKDQVAINRLYTGIQHDQVYTVHYPKDEAQGIDLSVTDHDVAGGAIGGRATISESSMAVAESLARLKQENPNLETGSLSELLDFNAEAVSSERHIVHYDVSQKTKTNSQKGSMDTYGDLIFMGGWPLANPAYPGGKEINDPVWGNAKKEALLGRHVYLLISDADAVKLRKLTGQPNINKTTKYKWYATSLPSSETAAVSAGGAVTSVSSPNRSYGPRGIFLGASWSGNVGMVFTTGQKVKKRSVDKTGKRTAADISGGGLEFEAQIRNVNSQIDVGYSNYGNVGPSNKKSGGGYTNGVRVEVLVGGNWMSVGVNATFYEFEGRLTACGGVDGCVGTALPDDPNKIKDFLNVPPMIQKPGAAPGTKIRGRPYIFKGEQLMASVKTKWEIRSGNWHFSVPHQVTDDTVIDPFAGANEPSFVAAGYAGGQPLNLKPWHTNIEPKANSTGMYDPRLARTGYAIMGSAGRDTSKAGWPPGIPCTKSQGKYGNIHDFKLSMETSWLQIPIGGIIDNVSMGKAGKTLYVGQCAGTAPIDLGIDVGAEGKWGPGGTEQTMDDALEHGLNASPTLATERLNEWLTHANWGGTQEGDKAFVYYDYDPGFKSNSNSTSMFLRDNWMKKKGDGGYYQPGLMWGSTFIKSATKYSDNIDFKIYQGMTPTQWNSLGARGSYATYMIGDPPKGMKESVGPIDPK